MGAASFLVHSAATFGSAHLTLFKKKLVDLVGIEPTTSSMPWKRAPSCATGPLFDHTNDYPVRIASSILADIVQIVNARSCEESPLLLQRAPEK